MSDPYATPPSSPVKLSSQPDWTKQIQCCRIENHNGHSFKVGTLPAGSSLYRVRPEDVPLYTHSIAWYSNYDLAETLEHGENIFKFTIPNKLNLLDMGDVDTINTIRILFRNLGYSQELKDIDVVFEVKNTNKHGKKVPVYVYRKSYKNEDFRVAEALKKIFTDLQGWFHLEIPAHTQRGSQEAEVLLFDNSNAGVSELVPLTKEQKGKVALRRSDPKKAKAVKRPAPDTPPHTPRRGEPSTSFTGQSSTSNPTRPSLPKPDLSGF